MYIDNVDTPTLHWGHATEQKKKKNNRHGLVKG